MSWLTNVLGGSIGKVLDAGGALADRFIQTADEKSAFKLEFEKLIQKRDSEIEQTFRTTIEAKERVMVAELKHGDAYTKRARPTVVYVGLAAIIFNYCVIPTISVILDRVFPPFELPTEFWAAWGGVVATWSIGRTMEKRGVRNKFVSAMTGAASKGSILD